MLRWYNSQNTNTNKKYSGGLGTSVSPYIISTLDDLLNLSESANPSIGNNRYIGDWSNKYFIQINDIEASSTSSLNEGLGFSPIGNGSNYFTSNYDGGNYSINNLFINRPTSFHNGLFGLVYGSSIIKNIEIANIDLTGGSRDGSLVGQFAPTSSGYISNCKSSGNIISATLGLTFTGGLVGASYGPIYNCSSNCDVSGSTAVGGLIGQCSFGTSTLIVAITNNCYSKGSVYGDDKVGGLVGSAGSTNSQYTQSTSNCYSACEVVGNTNIGGMIGITADNTSIINSYYDSIISGQSDTGKGEPKSTIEMQTESTFVNWDFTTIWESPVLNVSYPTHI